MNLDALANRSSRIFWLIRSSKVLVISAFELKLLAFGFLAVCSGLRVSDAQAEPRRNWRARRQAPVTMDRLIPKPSGERPLRVPGQGSQQAENGHLPPRLVKSLYRAVEIFVPAFSNLRLQVWKFTIVNDVE
jgi:hypothetical protein